MPILPTQDGKGVDEMKPILFNTEMVQAILSGQKTVTRRVVKPQPDLQFTSILGCAVNAEAVPCKPPYHHGDILWVRETWAHPSEAEIVGGADHNKYLYKADSPIQPCAWGRWHPSIHMPLEAARLFLRVTGVRVERLQDITGDQAVNEGAWTTEYACPFSILAEKYPTVQTKGAAAFAGLWDSTIKPVDILQYGWAANPWVWVIEFERCEKLEKGD